MKKINAFVTKYFWVLVSIIGLVKVWMISGMTIYQLGDAIQDNMLMVDYAENLGAGNWLGVYNNNTLLKRISYPMFMAVCNKLHISYLTGLGIFWTVSVVVLIVVLKKVIKNKVGLLLAYIFILFNPVMYSATFGQVIYRNAIVPGAVVLAIASLIGLFTRRNESKKVLLLWSLFSGACFAFFWNIREDSIWLLPFYAAALVITIIYLLVENKKDKKLIQKVAIIFISAVCVLIVNNGIKLVNYINYGVYTDTELFDTSFSKVKNLLINIDEEEDEKDGITVSRATLNRLFEVSPTLKEIEPFVGPYMYDNFWQLVGDNVDDGEVYGGYFFWAIRDAVQAAGYYESGEIANEFYSKVYDEINQAIDAGEIKLVSKGFTVMGIEVFGDEAGDVMDAVIWNVDKMIDYEKFNYATTLSSGNKTNLSRTEILTRNAIIYRSVSQKSLYGWVVPNEPNDTITLSLCDKNGNQISIVPLQESADVYKYFSDQGIENEKANYANFKYESNFSGELYLHVYVNGELESTKKISEIPQGQINAKQYTMYIGGVNSTAQDDPAYLSNKSNDSEYNFIIKLYKKSGNFLAILSLISFVIIFIISIMNTIKKQKNQFDLLLILFGILISYFILIYGVSAKYYAAIDSGKMWGYLAGTCPLQGIFISVSIVLAVESVINFIKCNKKKGKKVRAKKQKITPEN